MMGNAGIRVDEISRQIRVCAIILAVISPR
jgi:hypothetical protein